MFAEGGATSCSLYVGLGELGGDKSLCPNLRWASDMIRLEHATGLTTVSFVMVRGQRSKGDGVRKDTVCNVYDQMTLHGEVETSKQ